jgi:importin subunit beta-1
VKIASLYYDKLIPYMSALYQVTLKAIKEETGGITLQAIEFWSTICEEEIDILEEQEESYDEGRRCFKLVQGALDGLIPVLTEALTKQEEDQDEDTWNESMAASTCLSLVANTVGDLVVPKTQDFIKTNLDNPNWHFKEAAIIALGSIMEGSKSQELKTYINSILPKLYVHVKDPNSVHVRDTTAWVLGRICQYHSDVMSINLQNFVQILGSSLQDVPRVAANCAYALHEIAKTFECETHPPSSALSTFFQAAVQALLNVTERQDSTENNLRSSAYEAVNSFIQSAPNDCLPSMAQLIQFFLDRLHKTFMAQTVSQDDKEELNEQRALICGALYNVIQRLGSDIRPFADAIMGTYLQVLSVKSTTVHEEALIGVGALANALEGDFEKFLAPFLQYLLFALQNWQEYEICSISVGIVGDLSRAVNIKMAPYTDDIINVLLDDLKNPDINRNVKPPILSAFGDIALALGGAFEKYLRIVITVLQHASGTQIQDKNDEDLVDYINALRESIFDAYTGILQGLKSDEKSILMLDHAKPIVDFVEAVFLDDISNDSVIRAAIGTLGDLASTLQNRLGNIIGKDSLKQLVSKHVKSENQSTRQVAQWALSLLRS